MLIPALVALAASATAVELPGKAPVALRGIADCISANAPGRTMRQQVVLTTVDPVGERHEIQATSEWQRRDNGLATISLRVTAPAELRGATFLMVEQQGRPAEVFRGRSGTGELERIQPRAARDPMFGSDFTFEDFRRIQNFARARNSKLLEDTLVEGRLAWQIETVPGPDEGSAYRRIISAVDKERCVPLQAEFYADREEPSKLLLVPAAKVKRRRDGWLREETTMKDLDGGKRTVLTVESVELDVEIGTPELGP